MIRYKILTTIAIFLCSVSVYAQMPVLKVNGANDNKETVKLKKLDIDVQITGNIATTVMTMTFYNSSDRILEGELTFPMPEGVSVSRYALDINGKMREAVPVEKAKATEVFESIERRRVDPGLLEKVEGNNFRTRIYPLPAKGSRTVIIGYEEELNFGNADALRYHLPLAYSQPIEDFSLKTTVFESVLKPELSEQPDGSFIFKATGNTYVAEIHKTNYQPKNGLNIDLPKKSSLPEVQMQKASTGYYFLVNVFPKVQSMPRKWSNKMGLIWDSSLSGLQRDVKKELALLDLIIQQKQNLTIQLGLLNNGFKIAGTFEIKNGNWEILKQKLNGITYDGGTNFSALTSRDFSADEYLFFSDGLSTFGKNTVALTKPIHCINSSLKADYSTLKYISLKTGGQFINLNAISTADAFKRLSKINLQFLGIKNGPDVRQTYPSMHVNINGQFSLAGILNGLNTDFILQFGYGNTVVTEQPIRLNATEHTLTSIDISRVWAQKKIAEMDIQYETNKDDISVLSKQFGLVTRNTSLIVLENLDDYLRYDIAPPAELRSAYDIALKQRGKEMMERKANLLSAAFAKTTELKTWWNTDFSLVKPKIKKGGYPTPVVEEIMSTPVADAQADMVSAPPPPPVSRNDKSIQENRLELSGANSDRKMLAESVVIGNAQRAQKRSSVSQFKEDNQPRIVTAEFKSDKDYMKNLVGKTDSAYQAYLKIRPNYITTPMFYFDVANWFYQQKDSVKALTILSNIADLDLENTDLFKTLAYKLKQTGNYKAEIFITQKILQWRPMDAQSYRDYALALADDGLYQKALDNLYKVLTQSYNAQIANRDQGIEEIIISEINNLIAQHGKKLNTSGIDKKLILVFPVDVRVVLNWNKNDTDIDLWVTDPNGEKCFYSNPKTQIGGRISNDFTSGYGPEQFMVKKAIKGSYKIEVNYFGDSQFTISGPTTVTAEIYTRYGTGKEQRKVIVLPLYADNKKGNLVGEFSF
ncbi:DUF2135 domain-containing protein [Pedobacter changchengzhani]|uniref:DUF2135 domain-containing protein n=1 Tax=Pedobacter changchengzhani TaxID=2529274 RepID=A0A4R5MNP4_9SPHI|nr:VIT domain-containing protein [Pedobacter changchengzhani]TDG37391.1 DUF2135 domain-containing protein [Pedobacter changchengzhani]